MDSVPLKFIFFYCANSSTPDEIAKYSKEIEGTEMVMISLPCSGKVDLQYLLKAVETGADGVIILTCLIGNCKFLEGNLRAQKRADAVNSILEETGMGKDRIITIQTSEENDSDHVISEIAKYCNKIRKTLQQKKINIDD
jgi:coenzyme F420-reducing hydrogenase delta subunit